MIKQFTKGCIIWINMIKLWEMIYIWDPRINYIINNISCMKKNDWVLKIWQSHNQLILIKVFWGSEAVWSVCEVSSPHCSTDVLRLHNIEWQQKIIK